MAVLCSCFDSNSIIWVILKQNFKGILLSEVDIFLWWWSPGQLGLICILLTLCLHLPLHYPHTCMHSQGRVSCLSVCLSVFPPLLELQEP